ncbi:L-threonylcarbamoyladenylate synthase [Parasphaerochaeta coccoides]|uniref:L-threonylcarbamoyladenylate synthase n=1 Tax=Parasphaerochaeta coccoides (strain ATCC BAA-1237 / DSM 17374 / SPN1) TaxID=760011 RepID=F4GK02_PARC1|nr:L-threonylcarbamoyladenylate synthase [Parasphaerochaeta coccoides]AEC01774.1 SUA5/yciO/yrdC domain protein [Parasphaerochaeta coccoides DSM 17374]
MEHELVISRQDERSAEVVVQCLLADHAVILPCDTIYGLSARVPQGENLLREIKGRSADKSFLVLATLEMARSLSGGHLPPGLEEIWPAPLTAIVNTQDGGTIGIRVPDDVFIQKILEMVGTPIYSTSVNVSGEKAMLSFDEIFSHYGMDERIALFVIGSSSVGTTMASTIVDCTVRPYRILRQGAYDATTLIRE